MALINRWPLTPSLTGNDITVDIIGGLSLTNIDQVTMTEEGALFTGVNTKALSFNKVLGNSYSISFYAKSNGMQNSKWSPLMSADSSSGGGAGVFCDAGITYATSNWGGGAINIDSKEATILDGAEHLHVITFNNGKLKYYIDSQEPIVGTEKTAPSAFSFAIGRMGDYVRENTAWNGTVRDVRIYDHELNSDEISGPSVSAPTNLIAAAGDSQVTVSWTAVTGATGYNVKRSTTAGGPYDKPVLVTDTSYVDKSVSNGITYYYVVTAVNTDGESGKSNEASATPKAGSVTPPTPTGNVVLRVTMNDSSEREYRLSSTESDGFVNWYNSHKTTDAMSYALNDSIDNSKEYLCFEKIISFKVIPLAK